MEKEMLVLAQEIISGRRLSREDDLFRFLECSLEELCRGADQIRRHFCGNKVNLCTIINGKSGRCSEDCKYCAQSCHNHTGIDTYDFLSAEEILQAALANEAEGVHRFSVVTATRRLNGRDFEAALAAYRRMHEECRIGLCASHGLLTAEQFRQLKEAGVSNYHENIETSRRYFPEICTTHTYDDKIAAIRRAQEAGLSVCSGGIMGMGETWEDRLDMAISLAELGIKSIPINTLTPIPGTPMEKMPLLKEEEVLRIIAFFRYINPEADIRLAAGRNRLTDTGRRAFVSGASATITGNMLTTTGSNIQKDKELLQQLGREI